MEGVINYLDPSNLTVQVGEIYADGTIYLFKISETSKQFKVGQKVKFQLDAGGIAVNVRPFP